MKALVYDNHLPRLVATKILSTITPRMQEKILRVIEYGEIQRVGGSETLRVDVRIVGSTIGVVALAVTLALVACGDDPVDPGPNIFGPNPRDVEFAESLEIDLESMTETASGLFYQDDVVGVPDTLRQSEQWH